MSLDIDKLWVYRILHIENLESDLRNGLFSKTTAKADPARVIIGSKEIISARDRRIVKCYPEKVVNDFVPFYFSVRTPMLYNIVTGMGVPKVPQKDIVYLGCRVVDLATKKRRWCFTNANAADKLAVFYNDLDDLNRLDWHSIETTDFRTNNSDGDEDRIRKKHAEFLVENHVPAKSISRIGVLNPTVKNVVEGFVSSCKLDIEVKVKPSFYF